MNRVLIMHDNIHNHVIVNIIVAQGGRRRSNVSMGSRRKSSGSRTDPRGRQIRLTMKQKCGIASKEVIHATAELAKVPSPTSSSP